MELKHRFLLSAIVALVMMAMSPAKMWAGGTKPTNGDGTNSPYEIESADNLIWIRDQVNSGKTSIKCKLVNNINLSGVAWTPIGNSSNHFKGEFDGNGKSILNMTIKDYTKVNQGLFGYTSDKAKVMNFTLTGTMTSSTEIYDGDNDCSGTVVGYAKGNTLISNVTSSVNWTTNRRQKHLGGIAGQIEDNTIVTGCTYTGTINPTDTYDCIGGIVGYMGKDAQCSINYCVYNGKIIVSSNNDAYVGGILGYVNTEKTSGTLGSIKGCFSNSNLTDNNYKGGYTYFGAIIGYPKNKAIDRYTISGNYYNSGKYTAFGNSKNDNDKSTAVTISLKTEGEGTISEKYINATDNTPLKLQITAAGSSRYKTEFDRWSDGNKEATREYTLPQDIDLTAYFGEIEGKAVFNNNTMTFYYDGKTHEGTTYNMDFDVIPTWSGKGGSVTKVVFDESFSNYRPINCSYWFSDFTKLTSIEGLEYLNSKFVKVMIYMFYNCSSLKELDLSKLNTSAVTNMALMFAGCKNLKSLNLSGFNTVNVNSMVTMFNGCSGLESIDLSNFNTANVTDMSGMFYGCSGLKSLNLSNFNTIKVTDMSQLFEGCGSLESVDLSNFNTANVKDMSYMFHGCGGLESVDLSNFNTANVTTMECMFRDCGGLKKLNLSNFNTAKVTKMPYMFNCCGGLESVDLSNFNTANVKDMSYMFHGCGGLESIDLSKFNTANVTTMELMFGGCINLKSLNLSNFNTANVKNMNYMFKNCSNLESLDVSDFYVNYGLEMFGGCTKLKNLYIRSIPYMCNNTFNTKFVGDDVTVKYLLTDNSKIFTGTNYLPAATVAPTFTRSCGASTYWSTVVLPFEAKSDEEVQLYQLIQATGTRLIFSPVETVTANTPCVFRKKVKGDKSVVFTAKTVAAPTAATPLKPDAVDGLAIRGDYVKSNVTNGYMLKSEQFEKISGTTTLNAFRTYLQGNIEGGADILAIKLPLKMGDINYDDKINITDLSLLIEILRGNATDTNNSADVDGQNGITIDDLNALKEIILEK